LNTDVCKFESSQKDESRAQSADSSKTHGKRRAGVTNEVPAGTKSPARTM